MSGIFHEGKFYENADLVCRQCRTPLYDHYDYDGTFCCFSCGGEFGIDGVDEPNGHYMPPVKIMRPYDGITINTEMQVIMEDGSETMERVFKNQPEAEAFLMFHGYSIEDLEHVYFVECESGELAAALKDGKITIKEISEELDYRDSSGGNKWNDFLYEYTTAELERIEANYHKIMEAGTDE